ncbi:MAG: SH3 domain-containing protein, partial [bacterium]
MNFFCLCKEILFSSPLSRFGWCLVVWLIAPNTAAVAQTAILKDAATPIAAQPSPKSKVVAVLAAGDTVRILRMSGAWVQISFRDNKTGWMFVGSNGVS